MKKTEHAEMSATANPTFAKACLASCKKLIAGVEKAKDVILAEFRATRGTHEKLLRLALKEAEALAWQTPYPQLVFLSLATEKAQAVAAWEARQESIRRSRFPWPFAA